MKNNTNKSASSADNKLLLVVGLIVVALIGLLIYRGTTDDGNSALSLRDQLGELILLEEDEEARILTIDNADDVKENNVFYANAEDGDTLFVFQNRVMIFRESNNQLINVAPYLGGEDFDPTAESDIDDVTDIINAGSADDADEDSEN